jgi:hypothetical protein
VFWCHKDTTSIFGTSGESVEGNGQDDTVLTVSQNIDDTFGRGSDDDSEEMDSDVLGIILCSLRKMFYYESIKREIKRRLTYEYRYDERLKTKSKESTRLADTLGVMFIL